MYRIGIAGVGGDNVLSISTAAAHFLAAIKGRGHRPATARQVH